MRQLLNDIRKMVIFVQVVKDGSFTHAAESLGLGKSIVSEHISHLEDGLGVKLLNRTTRQIRLTEAGVNFLGHCEQVISHAQAALDSVEYQQQQPVGTLKITTTVDFGVTYLASVLEQFQRHYPKVKTDLILGDEISDIVAQGIDIAIRIGTPRDSGLIYRSLKPVPLSLAASHEYLQQNGEPKDMEELLQHRWISMRAYTAPNTLRLQNANGHEQSVKLTAACSSNSPMGAYALLLNHAGICLLSDHLIDEGVRQGRLKKLLTQYQYPQLELFALHPYQQHVPTRVRLFIDFLKGLTDETSSQGAD